MNIISTQHRQAHWLNSLVRRRSQLILAIPVTCLISSLVAFSWLQSETARAEDLVHHSSNVRLNTKRLLSELLDAETAFRGYALTRRPEFLEPYARTIAHIPESIRQLQALIQDNPSQAQKLQQIQSLAQTKIELTQQNLDFVKTSPNNGTQTTAIENRLLQGKQAMDAVRVQIEQFLTEEERLQQQRNQYLRQRRQLTGWVLSLAAVIGMGSSVFAAYLLNRLEQKLAHRECKLRESEARYRLVIENFPNGAVLLFNGELRYLIADGTAIETANLTKEQLEGKTIWEVLPPDICSTLEPIYRQALSGTVNLIELAVGDRIYQVHTLPVCNENGEILAGMAIAQDITQRKHWEEQLQESEERYRQLVELCPDGIFIQTQDKFSLVNRAAMHIFGATCEEQLIGKSIFELLHPDYVEIVEQRMQQVREHNHAAPLIEQKWYRLDGTSFDAEVTAIPLSYNHQPTDQVVIRDITKRKQAEQQLNQLNRLLKTLSECNQALVRATDEATLLQNLCQIIVQFGNYHSVWIGFAEHDEDKTVRPVAQVGFPEGYLESAQVNWSDTQQGQGPVGMAIRMRSPLVIQNVFTHPIYAPWREAARQRGYTSAISLPLMIDGLPRGALNIYATEPNAFQEAEVKFLQELAEDLAYGIRALRTQVERQIAQESLRDSEAKFRAFLESASEAIIVSNGNNQIEIFNAKAEELFGYDHTEVLGRSLELLIPEGDNPFYLLSRPLASTYSNPRPSHSRTDLLATRKNGNQFPIELGWSSIPTKDGVFIMTFITDITQRKQAEEEIRRLNQSLERKAREIETRYQQIVELAEEGIWVIDSEAKTTYINQAMARMLGYTEQEMLGRPIFDFMSERHKQIAHTNVEHRKQGIAQKHEFQLQAKDGQTVWTYMSTSPVLDEQGNLLWSCALVYNITDRKQTEEQLRQSSEQISLANAELARAARLKDEFLASMSHELRTPLNAILGLSEALQEEVFGTLTPKQHKSLMTIEQSGKHLLDLINDILDLSKIESGKMELQVARVSITELCQSSLVFVIQLAQQKSIKLNFKLAETVKEIEGDERRMRQVLINLLSNAVKFTPDGGTVSLEVEPDTDGEALHFSIIDTGIGIAPENISKLFQPFVQLDSSLARRYSGTGLGLALVQRIVELHHGSVSLESDLGKGSRFTVTIPWKATAKGGLNYFQAQREQPPLPDIHQALIVEDSETAAKQVARYLEELGTQAYIHPCGEGVIEATQTLKPDVIILDILLPDASGWEILQQLKANPSTQSIPVLVVSVVDERSHALSLGASEYLVKPISRQPFQRTLSEIFAPASPSSGNTALVVMPETQHQSPLILLAEDNEANLVTLMDYLQIHDFQVSVARNGLEAVYLAQQQKPNLILMDIQMPEMDGLEATRRIHSQADLSHIPIIALTALAMPGDRERCLAAGAKNYLTKPVGLKKLINIIHQYIPPSLNP
jgi:PAS domain S-box-containing protein